MKTIPLSEVIIPENRFRKVFDDSRIFELANDIEEIGLIHLPIIRAGNQLVSGERRFRAISRLHAAGVAIRYTNIEIPAGHLPYAPFEDLDEDLAKEIELRENTIRVDLPWQEAVQATAALHTYRLSQNPTQTKMDTSREILGDPTLSGGSAGAIITDRLALAENLHRPEVRQAKSENEAKKNLRVSLERDFVAEQRKRIKKVKSRHTLIHGEAVEEMKKLPEKFFDVIITDPPYGIKSGNFGVNVTYNTQTHKYKDDWEYARGLMNLLARKTFHHLCKDQAHLYLFCSITKFFEIAKIFTTAGWEVWPRPLIWYKHTGNLPKPDLGPKYVYEAILYANKGNRPTTGLYPDVIDIPSVHDKRHAAEKPIKLFTNLLKRSALADAQVLDPFAGSGPIFPAAHKLSCTATGIELDEDCIGLCKEQIKELG